MQKSRMLAFGLVALLIALVAGALWSRKPSTPQAKAPVVQAQAEPKVISSGVGEAAEQHAQLLAEAQKVPVPSLAPAVGRVPGQAQAQAVEALNDQTPQATPDAVPLDHQVAIGFTANVIGEVDPCG